MIFAIQNNVPRTTNFGASGQFIPKLPKGFTKLHSVFENPLENQTVIRYPNKILKNLNDSIKKGEISFVSKHIDKQNKVRTYQFGEDQVVLSRKLSDDNRNSPANIKIKHGENGEQGKTILFRHLSQLKDKVFDKTEQALTSLEK